MSTQNLQPTWLRLAAAVLALTLPARAEPPESPAAEDMQQEWNAQYQALQADLHNRSHFARVAPQTWRHDSLILPTDRDPTDVVLRRTAALLADRKRLESHAGRTGAAAGLQTNGGRATEGVAEVVGVRVAEPVNRRRSRDFRCEPIVAPRSGRAGTTTAAAAIGG